MHRAGRRLLRSREAALFNDFFLGKWNDFFYGEGAENLLWEGNWFLWKGIIFYEREWVFMKGNDFFTAFFFMGREWVFYGLFFYGKGMIFYERE
jgi:hypothetical protein